MTVWNPSIPDVVGLEWAPTVVRAHPVGTSPASAAVVRSTLGESIDKIAAYLRPLVPGAAEVCLDIYDASDLVNAPPWPTDPAFVCRILPGADAGISSGWTTERGATSNYGPSFDRCSAAGGTYRSYVQLQQTGAVSAVIRMHGGRIIADDCSTTIASLDGRRVESVTVRAYIFNQSPQRAFQVNAELALPDETDTVRVYKSASVTIPAGGRTQAYTWTWRTNPATGQPWLLSEVNEFLAGGDGEFGVRVKGNNSQTGPLIVIPILHLDVLTYDETRLATGRVSLTSGGWAQFRLLNPATGAPASWGKVNNHIYWIGLSLSADSVPVQWTVCDGAPLDALATASLPLVSSGSGMLDPGGTWPPTLDTSVPALVLLASGNASPDSAPYVALNATPVYVGQTIMQILDDGLDPAVQYGIAFAHVRAPATAPPDAPLVIDVIDRSAADAVVAGPHIVEVAKVLPDLGGYRQYVAQFAATFAPIAGHEYAVRCQSLASTATPWLVATLDTLAAALADASYGGSSASLVRAGQRVQSADALLAVAEPPPGLGGLTATLYQQPLGQNGLGACSISHAWAVRLAWGESVIPEGKFGYYELQRSDDTTGWQTIARLRAQSLPLFYDFEGRRNQLASYRVRQVRSDSAVSAWSTTVTAQPPAALTDFLIVCNVAPGINVAYNYEPEDQTYELLDSTEVVLRKLQGRDYQVEYRPLETRGDQFQRTLTISFADATAPVGRSAFYPIEQLQRARVPLLTVLDGEGHRWYSSVLVTSIRRDEPGGRYAATVQVTQLSATPAAPIATWEPGTTTPTLGSAYGDPGGVYGDPTSTYGT